MPWLSILKSLFSLANVVAKIVHDKQLMDAGEAKALIRVSNEGLNKIYKAKLAYRNADLNDPDLLHPRKGKGRDD